MNTIKICVNAIVKRNDGKVIAIRRKNQNAWSVPGGHLEFGEDIENCAKREVLEETDVVIDNIKIIDITNHPHTSTGDHYLFIWIKADYIAGELKNKEPERCYSIEWVNWDKFPEPIFKPLKEMMDQRKIS